MDPLSAINANTPLFGVSATAINPASGLLTSELSGFLPTLFGDASTFVDISGLGQLLSGASTFGDQLTALQGNAANSAQNQAATVASLAAQSQSLVDAYNNLQQNIAGLGTAPFGANTAAGADLSQALASQALASYGNGGSALTTLSQLGIGTRGTTGVLSLDLGTLSAAFNSDASGAFSLLAQAAGAFAGIAANFVGQTQGQLPTLGAQVQTALTDQLLTNSLLSSGLFSGSQNNSGIDLATLLALGALGGGGTSALSTQQALLAANQFVLVGTLLG